MWALSLASELQHPVAVPFPPPPCGMCSGECVAESQLGNSCQWAQAVILDQPGFLWVLLHHCTWVGPRLPLGSWTALLGCCSDDRPQDFPSRPEKQWQRVPLPVPAWSTLEERGPWPACWEKEEDGALLLWAGRRACCRRHLPSLPPSLPPSFPHRYKRLAATAGPSVQGGQLWLSERGSGCLCFFPGPVLSCLAPGPPGGSAVEADLPA